MRGYFVARSEEHTSELQSRSDLVCRLLLEKKKGHRRRRPGRRPGPPCGSPASLVVVRRAGGTRRSGTRRDSAPAPSCFFFNATATTEIYTLSLHDALPICAVSRSRISPMRTTSGSWRRIARRPRRSEEHTSELQSRSDLVCRLLLEKK